MATARRFPHPDRLSVVTATILLAYALSQFISLPSNSLPLQFLGIALTLQFNVKTVISLSVAGIMAAGADWLLRGHPQWGNRRTLPHLLLPALTAWIIGLPLYNLPLGGLWWVAFLGGGALLVLILLAEYAAVDAEDILQPVAASGLSALAHIMFLILAISLRSAGLRLLLMLPAIALGAGLVNLRTAYLRLPEGWQIPQAGAVALVVAQLAAALHYLPLSPIAFGLSLLGPVYALSSLIINLSQDQPIGQALFEPLLMLTAIWVFAAIIG